MSGCSSTTETNAVGHGRGASRRLRISSSQVSMAQHRTFAPPHFVFHYSATITDDVLAEAGAPLDFRVDFRVPRADDRLAAASRPASLGGF